MNVSTVSLDQISQPAKIANSGDQAFSGLKFGKLAGLSLASDNSAPAASKGVDANTNSVQSAKKIQGGKIDIAG